MLLCLLWLVWSPEVEALNQGFMQHYHRVIPLQGVSMQQAIRRIHNFRSLPFPDYNTQHQQPKLKLEMHMPVIGTQKGPLLGMNNTKVYVFASYSDQSQMLFVDEHNRPLLQVGLYAGLPVHSTDSAVQINVYALKNTPEVHYACTFILFSIACALYQGKPVLYGGLEMGLASSCRAYRKRAVCLPPRHYNPEFIE